MLHRICAICVIPDVTWLVMTTWPVVTLVLVVLKWPPVLWHVQGFSTVSAQRSKKGHLQRTGRPITYDDASEGELRSYVLQERDLHNSVSVDNLCAKALELVATSHPAVKASRWWASKFMGRHDLTIRSKTSMTELVLCDREDKIASFHEFVQRQRESDEFDDELIVNMGERARSQSTSTSCPTVLSTSRVVCRYGSALPPPTCAIWRWCSPSLQLARPFHQWSYSRSWKPSRLDHLRPDERMDGRGPHDALDEGRTPPAHEETTQAVSTVQHRSGRHPRRLYVRTPAAGRLHQQPFTL